MRHSKKGVTLVELVICCAIIVMLGGAATAVLMSGQTLFNKSSDSAQSQMDINVVHTHLMNLVPSAKGITPMDTKDPEEIRALPSGCYLFFDGSNLVLRRDGSDVTIDSVTGVTYSFVKAGSADSPSARAQLVYKITTIDGDEFTGGYVLTNVAYQASTMDAIRDVDLAETPLCIVKS